MLHARETIGEKKKKSYLEISIFSFGDLLKYPLPAGTFESMIFLFPILLPWRAYFKDQLGRNLSSAPNPPEDRMFKNIFYQIFRTWLP